MEQKTSVWKGLLGAVIGSLPGIIVWIILGYFGYTAALVGVLLAFGIIFGYMKLGGAPDMLGVVICIITMVVGIYLGVHLSYSVSLYAWEPDLVGCVFGLYDKLLSRDALGGFFADLGLGYLFGFAGGFGTLRKIF